MSNTRKTIARANWMADSSSRPISYVAGSDNSFLHRNMRAIQLGFPHLPEKNSTE
jgi:hypothetical protein